MKVVPKQSYTVPLITAWLDSERFMETYSLQSEIYGLNESFEILQPL